MAKNISRFIFNDLVLRVRDRPFLLLGRCKTVLHVGKKRMPNDGFAQRCIDSNT
jgi:hypothetical protein